TREKNSATAVCTLSPPRSLALFLALSLAVSQCAHCQSIPLSVTEHYFLCAISSPSLSLSLSLSISLSLFLSLSLLSLSPSPLSLCDRDSDSHCQNQTR